jgi:hypothetical protein
LVGFYKKHTFKRIRRMKNKNDPDYNLHRMHIRFVRRRPMTRSQTRKAQKVIM